MIFNMNFELRSEHANFGTKFGIFWQKLCEIDCNYYHCFTRQAWVGIKHASGITELRRRKKGYKTRNKG